MDWDKIEDDDDDDDDEGDYGVDVDDDDDLKYVIHPASTQARPSPNQSSERILNKDYFTKGKGSYYFIKIFPVVFAPFQDDDWGFISLCIQSHYLHCLKKKPSEFVQKREDKNKSVNLLLGFTASASDMPKKMKVVKTLMSSLASGPNTWEYQLILMLMLMLM